MVDLSPVPPGATGEAPSRELVSPGRLLERLPPGWRVSRRWAVALLVVATLVGALGWVLERRVARTLGQLAAHELEGTLATAVAALEAWLSDSARMVGTAARDPAVAAAAACTTGKSSCGPEVLERALAPYLRAGGFLGFALWDPASGVQPTIQGPAGGSLGRWAEPTDVLLRRLDAAFRRDKRREDALGDVLFLPPFLAGAKRTGHIQQLSLAALGRPLMVMAAPVSSAGPGPHPLLVLELPIDRFTRVLQTARAGDTGETYAFDRQGNLLSGSRFDRHLVAAGLLAPGDSATLKVAVRDPGGNLTRGFRPPLPRDQQPLTAMVVRAVAGGQGTDIDGYRDYRGVPVVGAWRWLPGHDFGVTTEMDSAEAFRTLGELRRLFLILMLAAGVLSVGLWGVALVTEQTRRRALAAERQVAELGQYRIVRKLGQGGMGTVYLATHALLRRPTAIKVLRADRSGPEAAARFEREVRATSQLVHPNTVAIYDYGHTPEGQLYYAMEYLEGISLEELVRRFGPLPAGRVIHLVQQVCGALAEAHDRGLAHRDIKPANLLVCRRGGASDLVKVLDFGLAKWYRSGVSHTEEQVLVGTPEYMAPELFESAEVAGPATDLYALGCVAYYLVTGHCVFQESSFAALCNAHLTRTPIPPSQRLGRPVDPALEAAILSCLHKRPEGRPGSAAALSWLLESSPQAGSWTHLDAEAWWRHNEQRAA